MSSTLPVAADRAGLRPTGREASAAAESRPGYRPDIEGLRGIAVLSVLAVHSFPQWIKGGFIGVDIFFVLSGYLISGILFQSLEAGRFSILDFYSHRVRRIFPALCLVLLACLVFSALFTFPSVARQVGAHVGAGALFLSNIVLWSEAGYFDTASEAKPLLHLWSLGIEEQFYIVWPLAAVFLVKYRRWALWIICGMLLTSFLLNVAFVVDKPKATFFLPPARFWELMVGALLAFLTRYHGGGPVAWLRQRLPAGSWLRHRLADAFAATGLLMLVVALWLIDKTDHFPGWWALLPTVGTFALLAAGPEAWSNRHILSQSILRFYGAISYPLYLWHWPLLSFPVVMGIPLTNEVRVMILIASVVLAALTYELVEKPIRFRLHGPRLPLVLCVSMGIIGLGGLVLKQTDGLLNTYPESVRAIAAAEFGVDFPGYRVDECFLRLDQGPEVFTARCSDQRNSGRKLILLWGDSHAASLYPGLAGLLRDGEPGHRLAQYTAAGCPPLLATPLLASKHCARTNQAVLEKIAAQQPATVVLAGHWSRYGTEPAEMSANLASLRDTAQRLMAMGVQRVVVFGHLPTWTLALPRVLLTQWRESHAIPARTYDHINRTSLSMERVVEQALAGSGAVFVSPIAELCDASGCLASTARNGGILYPVTFDDSHLTAEGSAILTQRSRAVLFH